MIVSKNIRILGLALYGPQAASHRVRLSQFQPGLAAAGIDLQIQSLLDNTYLQRSFSGRRPSIRGLLAAYSRRLQDLRQADRFDLAIVYAELLPFLPGWLERQLLQIPFIYDCDDAFLSLPRFQGQCLESCFYTDPMKTNDHNEFPVYATPLQR